MAFIRRIIDAVRRRRPSGGVHLLIGPERAAALGRLSYTVDTLSTFQRNVGLHSDGKYGPMTDAALRSRRSRLTTAVDVPSDAVLRPWRLTHYYVADETDYGSMHPVRALARDGRVLATVPAALFTNMSLEGTGRLRDGRLLNVDGRTYVHVDPAEYAPCGLIYAGYVRRMRDTGREPKPSRYFGIQLSGDDVVAVQPFHEVGDERRGVGYGTGRGGVPYTPYRTLAADVGAYSTSDRRFRGKGGLVPAGTRVFILEFVGTVLPDGTVHDGWFTVNDTGGGIFGAHFDVFSGSRSLRKKVGGPDGTAHVWFDGVAERCPVGYVYGLNDR